MNTLYHIGAGLKIILGCIILTILYHYVHVYEDPTLGLSFGFLGVFMIIRGISYYIFFGLYKLFASSYSTHTKSSLSYKLSLLLGIYMMINLTLLITEKRNTFIGVVCFIFFFILHIIFSKERQKNILTKT